MPPSLCEIDGELKAIYHSKNTVCIWFLHKRWKKYFRWWNYQ